MYISIKHLLRIRKETLSKALHRIIYDSVFYPIVAFSEDDTVSVP